MSTDEAESERVMGEYNDYDSLVKTIDNMHVSWVAGIVSRVIRKAKKSGAFLDDESIVRFVSFVLVDTESE